MAGSDAGNRRRAVLLSAVRWPLPRPGGWLQAQNKALQSVMVEQRRAQLIENASYTHTPLLTNTTPDARELESASRELGFDWAQREENLRWWG